MAEDSTTNSSFFIHRYGRNNYINLNFVVMRFHFSQNHYHHHHTSSSFQSIFNFTAAVLVNFLEVKYQGKNKSPFEAYPKTMFLAITSLLLYCLAHDAKSRFPSYNVRISRTIMAFSGSLSLASLCSILFPQLLCPVLYLLSILFSLCELPFFKISNFWKWMREVVHVDILPTHHQQGRPRGLVSPTVYLLRSLDNILMEEENRDMLPV